MEGQGRCKHRISAYICGQVDDVWTGGNEGNEGRSVNIMEKRLQINQKAINKDFVS